MTDNSTYPTEQFDRHGTPRNIPAADWTCKKTASYSAIERGLAASLVPYVSGDDVTLTRNQFLSIVMSRIADDLKYGTA